MSHAPRNREETLVLDKTQVDKKLQRPRLYRVLLHNDDYTTREFVVWILKVVFHKSEAEATAIMWHVHRTGNGRAGAYTREVAETKVAEVTQAAEKAEFPLLCTMEPEDTGDE
ncbi:MAG: ATP-dependent Clp protease adaptor ClpS [Deltaproteobacteria bacterium]|nr:ATP-dependent Clp protease adaptor ClpS [Deltaproteobacteria bacterium]